MRIMLDTYWLFRGGTESLRRTVRQLLSNWAELYPEDVIYAWTWVPRGCQVDVSDFPHNVTLVPTRVRPHALSSTLFLARAANKRRVDAIVTQNFAVRCDRRSLVFIHDMLFVSSPEWFTRKERAYFALMPLLAHRADYVVATTRTEAERIRASSPKIRGVVPVGLGVGEDLLESSPTPPEMNLLDDSRRPFVLSVGRLNVRKNLESLVKAFASTSSSAEFDLVIVGEPDGVSADSLNAIDPRTSRCQIRFVGYVSDAELRWLYENCSLFVYVSLGEGFGMPPVEALKLGARCLVSDISVFRETCGNSAFYVDPTSVSEISDAIDKLLDGNSIPLAASEFELSRYRWRDVVAGIRGLISQT
ncbi:glycosyltransferase family 4 protein [Gordonia jacobaea]|uniref:glycosyltransferase family 4 protein n=1 Tax=Gordonia TaxID=2053 RepID=UPI003A4DA608